MQLKQVSILFMALFCSSLVFSSCGSLETKNVSTSASPVTIGKVSPFPHPGFKAIFDGTSLQHWRMAPVKDQSPLHNTGTFKLINGTMVTEAGTILGLDWYTEPTPPNFDLILEWKCERTDDNSGVFVRFPDPEHGPFQNDNPAEIGVAYGFEIQINNTGQPAIHTTGAIYDLAAPTHADNLPLSPTGQWNQFEIKVLGQRYTVTLNGVPVTDFTFQVGSDKKHPERGLPGTPDLPRFIGLQTHNGHIAFRNIEIKAL